MSFEEPKAPIVRIRKKQIKKKSKEKDVVVQLPVRASRATRYSSLTPATDPQSKGRECCRHMAQGCFRIPFCRTICFRCILPPCFSGDGSDDEKDDDDVREERPTTADPRSSDIPQPDCSPQGATGGTIELVEMKTETVTLVPPPRVVNEYRTDPCSSLASSTSSKDEGRMVVDEKEPTSPAYIEIRHVKKDNPEDPDVAVTVMEGSADVRMLTNSEKDIPDLCDTVSSDEQTTVKDGQNESEYIDVSGAALNISSLVGGDSQEENPSDYVNMNVLRLDLDEDRTAASETVAGERKKKDSKVITNYSKIGVVDYDQNVSGCDRKQTDNHNYQNLSELEVETNGDSPQTSRSVTIETVSVTKATPDTRVYVNVDEYLPQVANGVESHMEEHEDVSLNFEKSEMNLIDDLREILKFNSDKNDVNGNDDVTDIHGDQGRNDKVKLLKRDKDVAVKNVSVKDDVDQETEHDHDDVTDQTALI